MKTMFVLLSTYAVSGFAAVNLSIVPNGPLPTQVVAGSSVTANFTVTNETTFPQRIYSLQGLPATVTQNTSKGNCPAVISLNPSQKCNLALKISGAVQSSFALCAGGSCSTASQPLNVSVVQGVASLLLSAGFYDDADGNEYLLMARKSLPGAWTYTIDSQSTFPTDVDTALTRFVSVACNENNSICISGGTYISTNNGGYPILAMSLDQGSSWTYPIDSSSFPSVINGKQNPFISVSCSGPVCIGVGLFTDNGPNPIMAQTTDTGTDWSLIDLPIPNGVLSLKGTLFGAKCLGQTCIAAGYYRTTVSATYFVLYQSTNGGTSWNLGIDSQTPSTKPTGYLDSARFNSVTCNSQVCMAAGTYGLVANGSGLIPVLAQSTNLSNPWSFAIQSGVNEPTDLNNDGSITPYGFNSVSCSDNICIAGGYYYASNRLLHAPEIIVAPVIAQTTNNGTDWTYGVWSGQNLPPDFDGVFAEFKSVSCSNDICIAGGAYTTNSGAKYNLMIAQSTDQGQTWTYPVNASNQPGTAGGIPSLLGVNSVSCQGMTCIASGSYNDENQVQQIFIAETDDGGHTWTFEITGTVGPLPTGYNTGAFEGNYAQGGSALYPSWMRELNHR